MSAKVNGIDVLLINNRKLIDYAHGSARQLARLDSIVVRPSYITDGAVTLQIGGKTYTVNAEQATSAISAAAKAQMTLFREGSISKKSETRQFPLINNGQDHAE